jgi:hypothetical protein
VLEQVLDENSPRWITGVKLTRLTMGDKVKHASSTTMGLLDLLLVTLKCSLVGAYACCRSIGWTSSLDCVDMLIEHPALRLHVLRTSGPPNAAAGDHICEGVQGTIWSIGWA